MNIPIWTLDGTRQVTYTVQKNAQYGMSWVLWGKSLWPKLVAKAVQAMANEPDNKRNEDYPIKPDMRGGNASLAFAALYGSHSERVVASLSDEDLQAQLSLGTPQVVDTCSGGTTWFTAE